MKRLNEAEWLIEPFYECETRGLQWELTACTDSARLEVPVRGRLLDQSMLNVRPLATRSDRSATPSGGTI